VGCGEGLLALALSRRAGRVTALDRHAPTLALARRHASAPNIDHVLGDVLAHPFVPASFDAVVSMVVLHHIGLGAGLERMVELLRPGGRLVVIGMAATRSPIDLGFDLAGTVATRLHKLTKRYWETSAPKVWPIPQSYGHERRTARRVLPGVRYRRLVLWRYSLVWTKPA
jgi:2-polyprenyl-3-methyl-5-hydroxy-6-metoxy-1,4-benzoquinol methylase